MIDELVRLSAELNDRTKAISEYWADGPRSELPPGHWNLFAHRLGRPGQGTRLIRGED